MGRLPLVLVVLGSLATGCRGDSAKVRRQKAVYFQVARVPRVELEREIGRTMRECGLQTQGQAMAYLLSRSVADLPRVAAALRSAGLGERPGELAPELQRLRQALEEIQRIEAEPGD